MRGQMRAVLDAAGPGSLVADLSAFRAAAARAAALQAEQLRDWLAYTREGCSVRPKRSERGPQDNVHLVLCDTPKTAGELREPT